MYEILMDERYHVAPSEVKARVEEYGIEQPSDLSELEVGHVEGFANMLKLTKKKVFTRLYSKYVTQSSE
jgi:hypothetical protein